MTLSDRDRETIAFMRERGFAVVVFSPEELTGTAARDLENSLVQYGSEILGDPNDTWVDPHD